MSRISREDRQTVTVGDVTVTVLVRTEIQDFGDERAFVVTARKEPYAVLVERDGREPLLTRL